MATPPAVAAIWAISPGPWDGAAAGAAIAVGWAATGAGWVGGGAALCWTGAADLGIIVWYRQIYCVPADGVMTNRLLLFI